MSCMYKSHIPNPAFKIEHILFSPLYFMSLLTSQQISIIRHPASISNPAYPASRQTCVGHRELQGNTQETLTLNPKKSHYYAQWRIWKADVSSVTPLSFDFYQLVW